MKCPQHPEIEVPDYLTCPLCAQEARRLAYKIQRASTKLLTGVCEPNTNDPANSNPHKEQTQ